MKHFSPAASLTGRTLTTRCFAQSGAPAPAQLEKARVFITDSQSWEIAGYGGGTGGGALRPHTEARVRRRPRSSRLSANAVRR